MQDCTRAWTELIRVMPQPAKGLLQRLDAGQSGGVREVRIRCGQAVEIVSESGREWLHQAAGQKTPAVADMDFCKRVFSGISEHSLYAVEAQLKWGYITLPGGVRVGVAGHAARQDGGGYMITAAGSFCFRIGRALQGCADHLMPFVLRGESMYSTLLIGPPGCGKTTQLRDVARQLSQRGVHVALVDERGEISGSRSGGSAFDLGPCCDVMEGIPKAQGMMMMVRSMAPEVMITDEIGHEADAQAILEAGNAGVKIIASAHAEDVRSLKMRPALGACLRQGVFERLAVLSLRDGPGTLESVMDMGRGAALVAAKPMLKTGGGV
ncbi:MAG: AAA family ATPase [Christensenellales bacterium]|jgi:stage III sporulation protein AA